ncbi:DnaJ-class molecular chaperone with C-terminal Zn finger domain [Xenococcus sp. PCC 7305]|uniref:tetratricopeptide repeat protein n=1 Tax=Xenococcus sp. PCC 7305 TaxID=102125 RepID=UPI0002ABE5F8|nr:DnaJ domain-containing protein [Xenococcus sp. PCC 7305]ELS01713.1 DnaJ-class molecular chaperone with C-terminal Zn finger domain [Xenococcus sp. PCC 7305]
MVTQRDYYLTLKISPDATTDEIKASFRSLARKYHPDLNPDNPEAAEYFKEISEAYDTLSDPLKRRRYDVDRNLANSKYSISSNAPEPILKKQKARDAQYFYDRGIAKTKAKQYQKAITEYSRAIALDRNFIEAYLQRSQIRHKLGDNQGVLDDCYRVITINPTVVKAYYYQGRARYSLGYVQASIESYSEAIRQDKDYAQAYYYRGLAYGDLKAKTLAIQDLLMGAELFRLEGNYEAYNIAKNKVKNLEQVDLLFIRQIKYFLEQNILIKLIFPVLVLSVLVFCLAQIFAIESLFFWLLSFILLLLLFVFLWSKYYI